MVEDEDTGDSSIRDVARQRVRSLHPDASTEQQEDILRRVMLRLDSRRNAWPPHRGDFPQSAELERLLKNTPVRDAEGAHVFPTDPQCDAEERAAAVARSDGDLAVELEDFPVLSYSHKPIGEMGEELDRREQAGDVGGATKLREQIREANAALDSVRSDPRAFNVDAEPSAPSPIDGAHRAAAEDISKLMKVSPLERAVAIVEQAQLLSFVSKDPARPEPLEVLKLAVRAMLGERDLPVDCLTRLRAIILRGSPSANASADLRSLVELVEQRVPYVVGENGFDTIGVGQESPGLLNALRHLPGGAFAFLTDAQCETALGGLLRPHGHGHRGAIGVAADVIIAAGAWGWTLDRRDDLVKAIDRAVSAIKPDV